MHKGGRRQNFNVGQRDCHGNMMPKMKPLTLKQEVKHIFNVIKRLAGRPFVRCRMRKRVRTGMIFLNDVKAGWWEKIDLERLDMLDTRLNLCGQLYGRHKNAYRKLHLTQADFVMYGFLPAPSDYWRPRFLPQRLLTRLWIKEIKKISAIAIKGFALLVVLGTMYRAMAQDAVTPYPKMAPIDQYLMTDRSAEIALARSAAPDSIARDAEVRVLGGHGFETAVKGKNGFVCIVGRGWTSAPDSEFWNPKVRVPMCVNAAAARSYLLRFTKETEWGLAGRTQAQMTESITAAIAKKELPPMESGAMCYKLSKQGYGGDSTPHWPPHLMFFYSGTDPAIWGANLPGSPVVGMNDPVEHLTQFVVAVQRWSDGTEGR